MHIHGDFNKLYTTLLRTKYDVLQVYITTVLGEVFLTGLGESSYKNALCYVVIKQN